MERDFNEIAEVFALLIYSSLKNLRLRNEVSDFADEKDNYSGFEAVRWAIMKSSGMCAL
jgi:hypothetical protein